MTFRNGGAIKAAVAHATDGIKWRSIKPFKRKPGEPLSAQRTATASADETRLVAALQFIHARSHSPTVRMLAWAWRSSSSSWMRSYRPSDPKPCRRPTQPCKCSSRSLESSTANCTEKEVVANAGRSPAHHECGLRQTNKANELQFFFERIRFRSLRFRPILARKSNLHQYCAPSKHCCDASASIVRISSIAFPESLFFSISNVPVKRFQRLQKLSANHTWWKATLRRPSAGDAFASLQTFFVHEMASQDTEVAEIERLTTALHTRHDPSANGKLVELKQGDNAWRAADKILSQSQNVYAKFFALQLLLDAVKNKWTTLPSDQALFLRDYVVKLSVSLSDDALTNRDASLLLQKNEPGYARHRKKGQQQQSPAMARVRHAGNAVCHRVTRKMSERSEDVVRVVRRVIRRVGDNGHDNGGSPQLEIIL